MNVHAASFFLLLNSLSSGVQAGSKCGTALYQACIGEGDKRYDPDVSANLAEIHPIFAKYGGFWQCIFKDYDGDTKPKPTKYVPANDEARAKHKNRPYNLTDVPAFINVTLDNTRLYLHELRVYAPAPADFCPGTPDDKHTNVMDADAGGVCGVTGWAEGGDIVRTSTHNKDEYSISVKSSGILSGGEPVHAEHHDEHHDGHRREEGVEVLGGGQKTRLLRGNKDAKLGRILRLLQDDHGSHGGGGHGGGGVEHPLHGVDNVLFAADSSSGIALQYAVKTFSEDFDSFVMRSGSFDLVTSAEIGTSQYTCKRVAEDEYETALSNAFETASVTDGTRDKLNLAAHGCLVPPCATEEDICTTDPSCSVSPYQEIETMKAGAIVGFCILGAAVVIAVLIFFYQRKINAMEKNVKAKFASRMRMSFAVKEGEAEKREDALQAFDGIDKDQSGLVSKEELWTYVHMKQDKMTKSEFDRLFKMIDKDGSNEIDFAEFMMFLNNLEKET